MAEKHYVFLKDNRVENIAVFANEDTDLANLICSEQGFDQAIWLDDKPMPSKWSTWDGKEFTPASDEYLISIGVLEAETDPTPAP
jgi:hypothetical protein